ncbi:hypothetical protein [Rubinisphaera margarita]|uniref:hypothetical protein n=1 Tax=Rubinisphaera margarita TaxID=2909586 RepID=UPI001EE8BD22|nr:hypothetical protein [Rubinisphaera margarita]MCG6154604.1 hypothetical protein [Rubinisphaera margarita]
MLRIHSLLSLVALLVGLVGCEPQSAPPASETTNGQAESGGHDHAEHDHPTEGPHHGELIELGNEEYHAEIIHDETAGTVTIYILDAAAKMQVPIESAEVIVNTTHDGQPAQHTLQASPDENDPEGKSSKFVSSESDLAAHLHQEGGEPRLVVTINGKSYRGTIAHDHSHEHDHAH